VSELLEIMEKLLKVKAKKKVLPMPIKEDVKFTYANISLAHRDLKKMMGPTNQKGGGSELVFKTKQTFKTRVTKKLLLCGSYHKTLIKQT